MTRAVRFGAILGAAAMLAATPVRAADDPNMLAKAFGARQGMIAICMSPDGKQVAYVQPGPGQTTVAYSASATGAIPSRWVAPTPRRGS